MQSQTVSMWISSGLKEPLSKGTTMSRRMPVPVSSATFLRSLSLNPVSLRALFLSISAAAASRSLPSSFALFVAYCLELRRLEEPDLAFAEPVLGSDVQLFIHRAVGCLRFPLYGVSESVVSVYLLSVRLEAHTPASRPLWPAFTGKAGPPCLGPKLPLLYWEGGPSSYYC